MSRETNLIWGKKEEEVFFGTFPVFGWTTPSFQGMDKEEPQRTAKKIITT